MEKRTFWILAVIQGICLISIFGAVNGLYAQLINGEEPQSLKNFVWGVGFAISTIWIEYAILNKK